MEKIFIFIAILFLAACSRPSETPLMNAAIDGNLEHLQKSLVEGANINEKNTQGFDALSFAIMNDCVNAVLYLLDHGANANSTTYNGTSALMIAATVGNTKTIKALLDHGAKINHANQAGITALMGAAGSEKVDGILTLLSYGADPCFKNKNNRDAFQVLKDWWGVNVVQSVINKNPSLKKIECARNNA